MNWNWFNKKIKEYPEYWLEYLGFFSDKKNPNRYVVFDCETTGLDYKTDRILSIGAVAIENEKIIVNDFLNLFLQQDIFKSESVPIHGILKNGTEKKVLETEAVIQFLAYIKNATLVGHHVSFDIEMINMALERLNLPKLKNQYMDTDIMYQKLKYYAAEQHTTLDELCDTFNIKKSDRHTASGDAFITALVFLKLKKKLHI
jgi:DNA polymerase III subunit epsilon